MATALLDAGTTDRPARGRAAREALRDAWLSEWRRWPLWLPVALGAGIALYFALPAEPGRGWLWAPWPPLLLALLLSRRRPGTAWGAAMLGFAALGLAAALWHASRAPPMPDLPRGAVVLSGRVAAVDILPEGLRVTLEAARLNDGEPLGRRLRVRLRDGDPARPVPGDLLSVRALLRPPAPPAYPGGWDFQRAAHFSGLGGSGFAIGPASATPGGRRDLFAGLRSAVETRVAAALPGAPGGVASALLTGSRTAIPPEALAALRDSGLAHLLSPSGMHVAIVFGLAYLLVRRGVALWPWLALRADGKAVAALSGLALSAGYALLTGGGVPMQRAVLMAALATLAVLVGRRALSPRALALAAATVLLASPSALLSPGFQMSFAAVLALIGAAEAMRGPARALRARPWGGTALVLLGLTFASLVAGFATLPFGLHHFGRLQLYGVAANALAGPLTSFVVMPAGLLALALMPWGLEGWALRLMGLGVEAILGVGAVVAGWPGAAPSARPIPGWGAGLFALGLCWLCLWRARWRWLGAPAMAAGLFAGALAPAPDLLISADARLIALRSTSGLLVERASGASRMVRETWQRDLAEERAEALPREGGAGGGAAICDALSCALTPRPGGPSAILLRSPPPETPRRRGERLIPSGPVRAETGCGRGAVLVSAEPIRGRCEGVPVVDRFSAWRDGAHAVWLSPGGARVLSDRAHRGERPWVPPVPRPRPRTEEPPAELDPGGASS